MGLNIDAQVAILAGVIGVLGGIIGSLLTYWLGRREFDRRIEIEVEKALEIERRKLELAKDQEAKDKKREASLVTGATSADVKNYIRTQEPELIDIEGIGSTYAQKLKDADVLTVPALLKQGTSSKGRQELENKTGISGRLILEWVNLADLFRIQGVGEEYSDLLEEAGVDTVPELAQSNPANLYAKIQEVNKAKKIVRQLPTAADITDWVAQAKKLGRIVQY